jgi:hypothetical protein
LKINRTQKIADFFGEAILDVDGTVVGTDAECKQGIDLSYNGAWGYHPLVVSLANTAGVLYLVNRSGNRPSSEQALAYYGQAIALCRQAGFQRIVLLGDTKFSQTEHLDGWDDAGDIRFLFGLEAHSCSAWRPIPRSSPEPRGSRPRPTASWSDRPSITPARNILNNHVPAAYWTQGC